MNKVETPISAREYLSKRAKYILDNRSWWSIHVNQMKPSVDSAFDKGYVSVDGLSMPITQTFSINQDKTNYRGFGAAFWTRGKQYAYGLSLDYYKNIDLNLGADFLVTTNQDGTSVVYNFASPDLKYSCLPLYFNMRYYMYDGSWIQPFAGLGMGATYFSSQFQSNITRSPVGDFTAQTFKNTDSSWSLYNYQIEAGATLCLSPSYSLDVSIFHAQSEYKGAKNDLALDSKNYLIRFKSPMKYHGLKVSFNIYAG